MEFRRDLSAAPRKRENLFFQLTAIRTAPFKALANRLPMVLRGMSFGARLRRHSAAMIEASVWSEVSNLNAIAHRSTAPPNTAVVPRTTGKPPCA